MTPEPNESSRSDDEDEVDREMAKADEANGEGLGDEAANDTEARYGEDESPS